VGFKSNCDGLATSSHWLLTGYCIGRSAPVDVKQATDAQIAALPQGDVQRLREKWGADEASFRGEAYELWLGQKSQDMIMQQILQESFKRTQEWMADLRETGGG
jgi:hypothetical protein